MKKHKRKAEGGGVNLSLIITPFLDVSFQLLAFFIMTYHPSQFEGHIDGNLLPPSDVGKKGPKSDPSKADDLPSTDEVPPFQDVLLVTIKTTTDTKKTTDGEPRMVLLRRPEDPTPTRVSEGDTWPNAKIKLKEDLVKILKDSGGDKAAKANIKLDGDADLKHQYMMEAFDVCKLAGYGTISFVSPVLERKKE